MAVIVWLVRRTELNKGRLGAVRVSESIGKDLIRKGEAVPYDRNLRAAIAEHARAEGKGPGTGDPAKKRGRPAKNPPKEKPQMENPNPADDGQPNKPPPDFTPPPLPEPVEPAEPAPGEKPDPGRDTPAPATGPDGDA